MKTLYWIQPSGRLHIGNYLWGLKLAIENKSVIMIANYHSLTSSTTKLSSSYNMTLDILHLWASEVVYQDDQSPLLAWEIQCITPMSDLQRMTQWKSKSNDLSSNVGLLTYPCLMAADIILSEADAVIIGEDQIQHMEYYRRTCERMGITKVATNILTNTPRIMSISDPSKKMSKSLGDLHCIYIWDHEENEKKIKKSPTTPEGIANLKQIAKWLWIEFDETKCGESKILLTNAIKNIYG